MQYLVRISITVLYYSKQSLLPEERRAIDRHIFRQRCGVQPLLIRGTSAREALPDEKQAGRHHGG